MVIGLQQRKAEGENACLKMNYPGGYAYVATEIRDIIYRL